MQQQRKFWIDFKLNIYNISNWKQKWLKSKQWWHEKQKKLHFRDKPVDRTQWTARSMSLMKMLVFVKISTGYFAAVKTADCNELW